ncbi:MAG: transposase, partial [bacterium]|nr:transposase [bacterium]
MVRYKRIYYHNAVYHITFRGNNRQAILKEEQDKISFLETLSKYKERFNFKLYCLVLMDNHVHLVIETNHLFNISKIMQSILLSYS